MKRVLHAIKESIQGKPLAVRSSHWDKVRDNFVKSHNTCAGCGNTTHLQVHHKKPFHLHPELELDDNNLITLCELKGDPGCHLKIGHLGDWKSFNPNVEADAKAKLESIARARELI